MGSIGTFALGRRPTTVGLSKVFCTTTILRKPDEVVHEEPLVPLAEADKVFRRSAVTYYPGEKLLKKINKQEKKRKQKHKKEKKSKQFESIKLTQDDIARLTKSMSNIMNSF